MLRPFTKLASCLTNGGIYDNMDVNPAFQSERNPPGYRFISGASEPFFDRYSPSTNPWK